MSILKIVSRLTNYYEHRGLWATVRRAALAVRRSFFSSGVILFYCDLCDESLTAVNVAGLQVEQKRSYAELSPEDIQNMISCWNPKLTLGNISERFSKGALLWLTKSDGKLAGYGWTLEGWTVEPHYIPLGQHDVHLFDFYVFPQYRGQGMNPFLIRHILGTLSAENRARAFIEAAEWNDAQLSSLNKTPFHFFGRARKWTMFHHTMVWWIKNEDAKRQAGGSRDPLSMPMKFG